VAQTSNQQQGTRNELLKDMRSFKIESVDGMELQVTLQTSGGTAALDRHLIYTFSENKWTLRPSVKKQETIK
jgi:hypothetical protein